MGEYMAKIIVADDNKILLDTIQGLLLGWGHEVDTTRDADELIEKTLQKEYDLIITDNKMNDGHGDSGVYAVKEIRNKGKATPIILWSTQLRDVKEKAVEAGATETLEKMEDISELKMKISSCLSLDKKPKPHKDSQPAEQFKKVKV